jgi:hypothetical protein
MAVGAAIGEAVGCAFDTTWKLMGEGDDGMSGKV